MKGKQCKEEWDTAACCGIGTNRIYPTINVILEQKHEEGKGVSYVDVWAKRVPRKENFKYKFNKARAYMAGLEKARRPESKWNEQGD